MTTSASGSNPVRNRARRTTAGVLSTGLVAAGLTAFGVVGAAPAQAAPAPVTNAVFTWDINNEVNAGAFAPGTWNLMSAGKVADPGAGGQALNPLNQGATWANGAAAGWKNTEGNVTIEDKGANGSYAPTTFDGTRTNSAGTATSPPSNTILAETRLSIRNGVGTLDPATDSASISWDGDATVLFYSGMTFFYLSDPELTVTNGAGTVTATVGGYATSMDDMDEWTAVPEEEVTIATLTSVDVTETGLQATPAYAGVTYTAPTGTTPQSTAGTNWGAFPQDFVDFQQKLGGGPYWYSSGGSADARKPANPLTVTAGPQLELSRTTFLPNGQAEVTVTGSGFDPTAVMATRPPLGPPSGNNSGGVYIAVGKFPENWRPSAGAGRDARPAADVDWAVEADDIETVGGAAAGGIELTPAGTFTASLIVDRAALDEAAGETGANYGIYTYPGGGATNATFETYTPITFAKATPAVSVTSANVVFGKAASASVAVTSEGGNSGSVTLNRGTTAVGTAPLVDGKATFPLGRLGAGRYPLTASYTGNDNTDASTATTTLVVTKAGTTTRAKVAPKPRRNKAGRAAITVVSPAGTVGGRAQVVLRNAKGKAVTKVRTVKVRNGKAAVKLPRAAKGRYRLVVKFVASANLKASTRTVTFRVA